ncbi:MAG: glycosyltransferase [Lachnospiraceae bacterium]|nr:glycosyltransferase [Lachnospiraceae bacterium]
MEKKISIMIPCYNEERNVRAMAETIIKIMESVSYDYEIVFTDNDSKDNTKKILRELAAENSRIKVLINNRNYGTGGRSSRNTMRYLSGDIIMYLPCDFQEPPELIPKFIKYWEDGYKVVYGQKTGSKEGKIKFFLRSLFYKIINTLSEVPQYENMSGLFLIDREVYDEFEKTDEDLILRYALADMGYKIKLVQYVQEERRGGEKSRFSLGGYLSFVMNSMVNTSTGPLRVMTIIGFGMSLVSFLIGLVYLIMKLTLWYRFQTGMAPILIGMFFLGSIQLLFMGVLGEYIGAVLRKVSKRPDIILSEKINFEESNKEDEV